MANLVFPQLNSGALAQYPISKSFSVRTVKNALADGDLILYSDAAAGMVTWTLEYSELSAVEIAALQGHFAACSGPFRAFTFLDPVGNLLRWSRDFTQPVWGAPSSLSIGTGLADPDGGNGAWSLTNNGQIAQGVSQTLAIPAAYQYVFSMYVSSPAGAIVTLTRSGQNTSSADQFSVGSTWQRISTGGALVDPSETFSVAMTIAPGQQLCAYAPQLEPQSAPSRARLTGAQGGVYANAHWSMNSFPVIATAQGLFATTITIEAAV